MIVNNPNNCTFISSIEIKDATKELPCIPPGQEAVDVVVLGPYNMWITAAYWSDGIFLCYDGWQISDIRWWFYPPSVPDEIES